MELELGTIVSFSKHLKKRNSVNWYHDEYDKERNYVKWDEEELKEPIEGMICGKRNIHYRGYTSSGWGEPPEYTSLERKTVFLVANNMMGFYRVPEEWLEIVPQEYHIVEDPAYPTEEEVDEFMRRLRGSGSMITTGRLSSNETV